jgi:hypothetical protein
MEVVGEDRPVQEGGSTGGSFSMGEKEKEKSKTEAPDTVTMDSEPRNTTPVFRERNATSPRLFSPESIHSIDKSMDTRNSPASGGSSPFSPGDMLTKMREKITKTASTVIDYSFTVVTPFSYCLPHSCCTRVAQLLHYCHTVVTLLSLSDTMTVTQVKRKTSKKAKKLYENTQAFLQPPSRAHSRRLPAGAMPKASIDSPVGIREERDDSATAIARHPSDSFGGGEDSESSQSGGRSFSNSESRIASPSVVSKDLRESVRLPPGYDLRRWVVINTLKFYEAAVAVQSACSQVR